MATTSKPGIGLISTQIPGRNIVRPSTLAKIERDPYQAPTEYVY